MEKLENLSQNELRELWQQLQSMTQEETRDCGDGNQTRDFIYVDDICHAIMLAMEKDHRSCQADKRDHRFGISYSI